MKVDGFEIFEALCNNKKDGGTVIGAFRSLNLVLVKEYHDEFELIVIEIEVNKKNI